MMPDEMAQIRPLAAVDWQRIQQQKKEDFKKDKATATERQRKRELVEGRQT
jgi:hypothetical protein